MVTEVFLLSGYFMYRYRYWESESFWTFGHSQSVSGQISAASLVLFTLCCEIRDFFPELKHKILYRYQVSVLA
jgi:hypothetical protein